MLELGCAAGGNIIPLALRFPGARFRGVDLTERHVRDGKARIDALELKNIRIDQGDIAALDLKGERFDYIVCHGVYSWVPAHVRDAILRICSEHLADSGVAYISYNVYPGWQLRNVVRHMMVYHAGTEGDPNVRVARARSVLDSIANAAVPGDAYREMLRNEASQLANSDDSYILGEFLADNNEPCYFHEFSAKADGFGLAYLCDAELADCFPEHISADTGALIRRMAANSLIPLEQYMDFFKGRSFRRTLMVKAAQAAKVQRMLAPERMRGLHVNASVTFAKPDENTWVFSATRGQLNTRNEAVGRALQRLSEVYPATRTVRELAAEVRALDQEESILDAVFKLAVIGLAEVSTIPLRVSKESGAKPKPRARRLPRLDAKQGQTWTTNIGHNTVPLDAVCVTLLPFLDGAHDRDALKAKLLAALREGRLQITDKATGVEPVGPGLERAISDHVEGAIERLAAAAILE
jgi:methyltransferase-like protein